MSAGLSPAGMAASFAAPDPYEPNSGIRIDWRGNVVTVLSHAYGLNPKHMNAQLDAVATSRRADEVTPFCVAFPYFGSRFTQPWGGQAGSIHVR